MTSGIDQILGRINEIQKKMQSFQPQRVNDFQQYYRSVNSKFDDMLSQKMENNQPAETVEQPVKKELPVVEQKPVEPQYRKDFANLIKSASKKYGVPENLIRAVIKQESGFNPKAVSHAGASGLMQLMPRTAKSLQVTDIFDPKQNVFAGTKYLKGLMNHFNGNLSLSLAAYNAGIKRVIDASGIPNIRETKNYVKSVISHYNQMKRIDK